MQRVNLGEAIGSGITRINNSMKEYNLKCEFKLTQNWFTIIFYRPIYKESSQESSQETVEKTVGKIIELIKNNSSITSLEIANKLELTERAIKKQISNLKKEGLLERTGSRKKGQWKIIE
jgi:ATP-dependent DNA helicase RecG